MIYPSLKEFLKLSKKSNVIPVYKEVNADLDTPVSVFLKMQKGDYAFLLESVEGPDKIARFSFLGANPAMIFKSKSGADPLNEIKKVMRDFKAAEIKGGPRFCGGMVGYIGYDAVRFFEKIPDKNPDDLKLADSVFMLADTLLVFDHLNHTIKIVANAILPKKGNYSRFYQEAVKKIEKIENQLREPLKGKIAEKCLKGPGKIKITSNYTKQEFCDIINKAKRYIKRGDNIQVVLSQRFKVKIKQEPFDIYRKLRAINPSPYMFFLKLKDVALVGSSPEIMVRCENGIVETRPIAGTRKRGKTSEEDKKLEKELLGDIKERAEHVMLVDLARNDLGRVCKAGSVKTSEFMSVEKYSHVMHLVTDVKGELNRKFDIYDVLRASFPAGTVSGSPKIRAMQIIDELENSKRGPYAGCVGYFSFSHNMDTGITIRTIVVKDGYAYVQAGAGIVADSKPEKEYLESQNKAKALMEAIRG